MAKLRPTWASLSEKTGSGYVPLGTGKDGVQEFVEHDCNPPKGAKGPWQCWCGRVWRESWL